MSGKRSTFLAASAAIFVCAVTLGSAHAAPGDLEQKSADARNRIEQVSQSLNQNRSELDAAQAKAESAASRESELGGLIANGAERSAVLGQRVSTSEKELEDARKRLNRAEKLLADRLVAIYMAGTPDMIDLALSAGDFGELASQREYLLAIQEADQRLAERVRSVRNDFKDQTADLTLLKSRVDSHNAELAAAQAGITAARASAESSAAQLASVNDSRESEIATLKSDINSWQKQIEKENAAAAATKAEAASAAEEEVDSMLGGPYSIPTYIVMCESGGNYAALNPSSGAGGAYQIMPATWEAYGGKGLPNEASKAEQDRIAALIYADSGTAPWVCG
ncbi:MAG: transglycosylase family protein [Solirubrobacterales bacterium]